MSALSNTQNIVLIGMPWCGKSTVGVLLAKVLARPFVDADVMIQAREGRKLQAIIDTDGVDALCAVEEAYFLSLECTGHVIATGGSVVYSPAAIAHLKASGVCVFLSLPLSVLEQRATGIETRGVVRTPGQTLEDLFRERVPLYEQYADFMINCQGLTHERVLVAIINALRLSF